jgi:hypothetical protein
MAISNMQQPRQMYGLGSFVKKFTRPIKKVLKSPLGKAALGAAALYGVNRFGIPGTSGMGRGSISNFLLGKMGNPASPGRTGGFLSKLNPFKSGMSFGQKALIYGGLGATALPFFTGGGEDDDEGIVDGFDVTPDSIKNIRAMSRAGDSSLQNFRIDPRFAAKMGGENYYTGAEGGMAKLNMGGIARLANGGGAGKEQMMQALQAEYMKYKQQGGTMPFEQFAKLVMQQQGGQPTQMAADGGRMGYNIGGPIEEQEVINEDTQEVVSNPDPMAELNNLSLEIFGKPLDQLDEREQEALQNFISQNPEEEIIDTDQTMVEDRVMANAGGMIDYMSSANPMAKSYLMEDTDIVDMYRPGGDRQMAAEGGIMDLGGMEKDYREDGGFVPIGGKEKADDVPARLSKNEFVFTADAVRNAGGGDIDQGAAVMQRMMDNLEQGGEISEESQGGNPAQEMFDTSQQLESRIA